MYCIEYVIQKGDTLYKISRQFNVTIDMIMRANPLVNVYQLQPNEVLCIPVSVPQDNYTNYTTYLVQEGDTLGSILDNYHLNMADLMRLNEINEIRLEPGSTINVPIFDNDNNEITL
ncbi:MAG: hypothetical protein K0S76_1230 [Herbinix sp.]|jgi:LysM repeat protein|nr:hypothetical protein [Herbinix sp.]